MLRTLICASALSFIAFASPAFAEDMPATPMGMTITGDDGTPLGRVDSVGRNAEGRIISIGVAGMAPPSDAPATRSPQRPQRLDHLPPYQPRAPLVAMNDDARTAPNER